MSPALPNITDGQQGAAEFPSGYRGRLAPSPTGHLHLGHARTFWAAQQRAVAGQGALILRIEDLDPQRCKPEWTTDLIEDLRWFGFQWQEGPDVGGSCGPYVQSARQDCYRQTMERLRAGGWIYPCTCSRQDVMRALQAPHQGDEEPVYPGTCRSRPAGALAMPADWLAPASGARINWRFRVPDDEAIAFVDGGCGAQTLVAGRDFGDFVVWRHDGVPAYQLAVVADDLAMGITEVVRGMDLLVSTARQLLLYRALGAVAPAFYHCPLVTDAAGVRLAKRHDALSLRALRQQGLTPEALRAEHRFG